MFRRLVFWEFPRASWQYDVVVALILAFLFLTPRAWFRDQPRIPHASTVAMLSSTAGETVYWLEPELLMGVPEERRVARANEVLRSRTGKNPGITRVEPILDSEKEIKGFVASERR